MEQPKKRHQMLVPISKKHHKVLLLAQVLRSDVPEYKGYSKSTDSLKKQINEKWESLLNDLLKTDQRVIAYLNEKELPAGQSHAEGLAVMGNQLRAYHEQLAPDFQEKNIDLFALQLIAWVRFKERQLFQWMQQNLSDAELESLFKDSNN